MRLAIRPLATLALTASLALAPQAGQALNVVVEGTTYDLETYTGTYNANTSWFATPAAGGRMPWWGNPTLAAALATELAAGLSPSGAEVGPLFATAFDGNSTGEEVDATAFDLTTLGDANLVGGAFYASSSIQTYAVLAAPVPAPLPIAGTAFAFSAMQRLRRRSRLLHQRTGSP